MNRLLRMRDQKQYNSDVPSLLDSNTFLIKERKSRFFELSNRLFSSFRKNGKNNENSDNSISESDSLNEETNAVLQLRKYQDFLEKLAWDNSDITFSNGGIEHATVLMSVLFQNTKKIARIYCIGFRPILITRSPYWESLNRFLEDPNHIIHVLVEDDNFLYEKPLQLLKEKKEERKKIGLGDTIIVKAINDECKQHILETFDDKHCNFAIFDDDKYRYEYDPENFRAYGSFNQPDNCNILKNEFKAAFDLATRVLV